MRYPPSFLDDIRNRVSIASVVGRKVAWDRRKSNPGRGDYWACCPFHGEKSASFHVTEKNGRYYCFGCKETGDIFKFLTDQEGLSFPEAVQRMAEEAGLPMPQFTEEDVRREEQRASLYDVMEAAAAFFEAELQTARGAKARGYLSDRMLPVATQREFRMGYAPDDRNALRAHLLETKIPLDQQIEAGLLVAGDDIPVAYDRFRDRVMFPIRDPRGRVIAFGGRAMAENANAKYVNSPETPLFHKGAVLYHYDKARAAAHSVGSIIAVEGYMDVIAMHRAGFANTVAPLGTALTADQLALLWKTAPEPVLCFDGDSAGTKAAYRALDLALPLLSPGHSLRFALLPDGQDPDDVLKTEGPAALKDVIEKSEALSDVLWKRALAENDRTTPERKAQFERDVEQLLTAIADRKVRSHYQDDMRARLLDLFGRASAVAARKAWTPQKPRAPWKRGQPPPKPWDVQAPASAGLRASAHAAAPIKSAERREGSIVLTLINHPGLLDDFLDDFAAAEFTSRALDSLRKELIDAAALGFPLENGGLRGHLTNRGHGPLLASLDTQAIRLNEWFSVSDAASADARTALTQMIALHRKHVTLERELRLAEAAFAADPTEAMLETLNGIREELRAEAGSEATIAGFGAASGRPQEAIT